MIHHLLETYTDTISYPNDCLYIEDGNALVHLLKDLPLTFGEMCLMVLVQMVHKNNFVFLTDSCHPDFIKSQKILCQSISQKHVLNEPVTRKPNDMKELLCDDENKNATISADFSCCFTCQGM